VAKADHLKLVRTIGTGEETIPPTLYSVTISPDAQGGTVIFATAPSMGEHITILRKVPFHQELDLENQGPFYAEDIESALDLAAMRDQELREELNRTVKVPASDDGSGLDQLSSNITRLAQSADNIDTLAPLVGEIDTVSDIAADIPIVAAIAPQVPDILGAHQFAHQWATSPANQPVNDGTNPVGFSAYHWAQKAQTIAGFDPDTKLDKTGGTLTGNLQVQGESTVGGALNLDNWIKQTHDGPVSAGGVGYQIKAQSDSNYFAQIAYAGGGGLRIYVNTAGDVATFGRDGGVKVAGYLKIGNNAQVNPDGNILSSLWSSGNLHQHIEDRAYAQAAAQRVWCVTDSRVAGWAESGTAWGWNHLPSGYVVTSSNRAQYNGAVVQLGGRQLQLYMEGRGWFALGAW